MPSDFGRCVKEFGKPVEAKTVCAFFEMRDDERIASLRQKTILEMLSEYLIEINDLLTILQSDRQECKILNERL